MVYYTGPLIRQIWVRVPGDVPYKEGKMKLTDKRLQQVDDLLQDDFFFKITDKLVKYCYHRLNPDNKIQHILNENHKNKLYGIQYEYMRRNLLKVKYLRNNNSASNIKEGFVYAIHNPAYPDYVKIGSAIDVYDRLNSYQTSSPFRDYELLIYFFAEDRIKTEKEIQNLFERNNEWCKVSKKDITNVFRFMRKRNSVK